MYYQTGSESRELSAADLKKGLFEALDKIGLRKKVLAIPPDYTSLATRAGEPIRFVGKYFDNGQTGGATA